MLDRFLFVYLLAAVLLVCLWIFADAQFRTKLVLTALYAGSWLLALWTPYAVIAAQVLLAITLGGITFGTEFLSRRH